MSFRSALRRPRTWLIAIPVVVLLAVVVAPYVYIHFIKEDAPPPLSFADVSTTVAGDSGTAPTAADPTPTTAGIPGSAAPEGIEGTWKATQGSQAGYRAKEILFGQDTEGVGRTSDVTGEVVISGTTIQSATFTVDLTTVKSDESRRDGQFQGRLMNTARFPTATFELTTPIELGRVPADLEEITVQATGQLTLRGVTNPATFDLTARRNGATIEVTGVTTITFSDYQIPDPSNQAASVGDNAKIELLLVLAR